MLEQLKTGLLEKKLNFVFKLMLLIYLYMQSLVIFHRTVCVGIVFWIMLCLGGLCCVLRVLNFPKYIKMPGNILLFLFLLSYFISIVVNKKYGMGADLANLVVLTLTIILVYVRDVNDNKEDMRKEIHIFSKIFIALSDICMSISFIMLFAGYGKVIYFEDYQLNIGMIENRLWGVFGDPNIAAVFAVVSIIMCIYYIIERKNKIFYCSSILISMLYLAFSDSRTGAMCLFFSFGFIIYMSLRNKFEDNKKNIGKQIVYFVISVTLALVISEIPSVVQKSYNNIMIVLENSCDDAEEKEESEKRIIKRDYDLSEDISNKRFEIWKSGLEIFASKPITGIGFHHLKEYAREEVKDTYLAQEGVRFSHLHNELLNILVSQGIIGFVIIVTFAISSIIVVFKAYGKADKDSVKEYTILLGSLLSIVIGMMLQQGIFYTYMALNLLFWLYLGYLRVCSYDKE